MVASRKMFYIYDGFFTFKNWRVRRWIVLLGDESAKFGDTNPKAPRLKKINPTIDFSEKSIFD